MLAGFERQPDVGVSSLRQGWPERGGPESAWDPSVRDSVSVPHIVSLSEGNYLMTPYLMVI